MLPGVGIFGTGNVVEIIVPLLREKGFTIKAIWGKTLQKAEQAAKLLGINYYTNKVDDVLLKKDVELILVMCSPHLQAQISVKALGIGKHVVCDKPAGLSQAEAIRMVHASQYYPSLISIVNHSLRFLPTFCQMRRAIVDGYLGSNTEDITVCDINVQMGPLHLSKYNWLCEETMGGGVVTLVGSHVIDLVTYLISQRAVRVHAVVKNFTETTQHVNGIRRITSPDYCTFQMYMNGNALVNVTLNTHLPCKYNQEIIICGREGYLAARGGDLFGYKNGALKEDLIYSGTADDSQNESQIALPGKEHIPKTYIKGLFNMIDSLKEAFLSSVEDKTGWVKEPVANASTFEDSLYVQAVIHALKTSSANRSWECVEIMTEEPLNTTASVNTNDPLIINAVRMTGISL